MWIWKGDLMADERPATAHDLQQLRTEILTEVRAMTQQIGILATAQADARVAQANTRAEFIGLLADTKNSVVKAEAVAAIAVEKAHSETSVVAVKTLVLWAVAGVIGGGVAMALISKILGGPK